MLSEKMSKYKKWMDDTARVYRLALKRNSDILLRDEFYNFMEPNNVMFIMLKDMNKNKILSDDINLLSTISDIITRIPCDNIPFYNNQIKRSDCLSDDTKKIISECIDYIMLSKKPKKDTNIVSTYVYIFALMRKCYLCLSHSNNQDDIGKFNNKMIALRPVSMHNNNFTFPESIFVCNTVMRQYVGLILSNDVGVKNIIMEAIKLFTEIIDRNRDTYEQFYDNMLKEQKVLDKKKQRYYILGCMDILMDEYVLSCDIAAPNRVFKKGEVIIGYKMHNKIYVCVPIKYNENYCERIMGIDIANIVTVNDSNCVSNPTNDPTNKKVVSVDKKQRKKTIPKALKQVVWDKYIGCDYGKGKCVCCGINEITQMNFQCGHIVSEFNGGDVTLDNLKPICGLCNSSMGTRNMDEFMSTTKINK